MARAKPKWRRVLNARYLRWRLGGIASRAVPALGRWMGFFPDHVGLIEGADRMLADEHARPDPVPIARDRAFLEQAFLHDSHAPDATLPEGVVEGRRTAVFDRPWIDMATGSVLLPDRARTVLVRGLHANWNATSIRPGRARFAVPGRVIAPIPTVNYFHQIMENAVHLVDLMESGLVADRPPVVATRPPATTVEKTLYNGLGRTYGLAVRTFPAGSLIAPDEAVVNFPRNNYWEWPSITPDLAQQIAAVFDSVHGEEASAEGPADLYLSRGGAKLRVPVNEADMARALADRGFHEFVASDGNHAQQMARFRAARRVVAVHGAGLTNLVFCRPGTRVVEIFPGNFVKSPFWAICQRLGLDHRPVIAGPGDYDQRFTVDIAAVLAALEEN